MISGKIGFLNYQDHTIMIRKKVEKLTDMKLNLKLINLQKTGGLVWKLVEMNITESFTAMIRNILVIEKLQVLEEE